MKKLSIRSRMVIWVFAVLFLMILLVFFVFRMVSTSVLEKTIRNYLIGAVETNTDEITFLNASQRKTDEKTGDLVISHGDGFLRIDEDFMDSMNDVECALYTEDGKMLYGKNPIAKEMEGNAFLKAHIYKKNVSGGIYYIYDRKLVGEQMSGLWIRGVVPMTQAYTELKEITKTLLFFIPVLLVVMVFFGYLTAGQMLRPIRGIEQSVADISGGEDLSKRIPSDGRGDEIDRLAVTYNEMLDRLETSFEKEKQFTSDASHELRTPMAVIMAQVELVLSKDRTNEEYRDALRVIERQGNKMTALIEDMLTFTRLDQGERSEKFPVEDVDFSALVQGICDDMGILAIKDITLSQEIEQGIRIEGNSLLLSRLVQNLIDNAYKYGKEKGQIRVRLRHVNESEISLTVEDDGIGIEEEDQSRIFDRFFRSDRSRARKTSSVKGSGLGLSIVKKIADYHRAEVHVDSRLDEGSTFEIIFKK